MNSLVIVGIITQAKYWANTTSNREGASRCLLKDAMSSGRAGAHHLNRRLLDGLLRTGCAVDGSDATELTQVATSAPLRCSASKKSRFQISRTRSDNGHVRC